MADLKTYQTEVKVPQDILDKIPEGGYPYFSPERGSLIVSDPKHADYIKAQEERLKKKAEKAETRKNWFMKLGASKATREMEVKLVAERKKTREETAKVRDAELASKKLAQATKLQKEAADLKK